MVLDTFAMLDPGATDNYMDAAFAKAHKIPLDKKLKPVHISTVDGTPIKSGPVTHATMEMDVNVSGHQEKLSFDVADLGAYPLILGIAWHRKHDPQILWSENRVVFNSATCLTVCNNIHDGMDTITVEGLSTYPVETMQHDKTFPMNKGKATKKEVVVNDTDDEDESAVIASIASQAMVQEDTTLSKVIPHKYKEFLTLFSKKEADKLPEHTKFDHKIELKEGCEPPFGRLYSMSEKELKTLSEWMTEHRSKGFIRRSTSSAGAPVLFVKKKDGSLRLVVDYRGLNNVTKRNSSPIPLIQETLDRLNGSKVFTKLDLRGAYNLLRMRSGDEWKTAFRTRHGLYEFLVMPFGLTGAPATFQAAINEVLRPYLDVFVVVYMDDILIFSDDQEKHDEHVKMVLKLLQDHNFYVKAEKCEFDTDRVEFLGFIIDATGVSMDPAKVSAIMDWPVPKSVHDIQVFNGFANFYRRFIPNYSKLAAPMYRLLRKGVKFEWTPDCQAGFDDLKRAFTTEPILAHFVPTRKIVIETDASDYALGAIISQYDESNVLHPIAFYSRTYLPAECNYEIYDKELLAVIAAFKEWRHYCEGAQHPITVLCDHENLQYFMTSKNLSRRQARWAQFISRFEFHIQYRKGTSSGKPDALSRRSDKRPTEEVANQNKLALLQPKHFIAATSRIEEEHDLKTDIVQGYEADETLREIIADLKNGKQTKSNAEYVLHGDLLMHNELIVVPESNDLRLRIVQQHHDAATAGHFGPAKTYELVTRQVWWPGIRKYIKSYCHSCDTCKRIKPSRHQPYGLLNPLPVPKKPWSSISMDFVVKLPASQGHDSVFVVVDRLTKMAHFIPCKESMDAAEFAQLFITHVFKNHGFPDDIVSDRGTLFRSKFWKKLMELTGTKTKMSTSFHPETDGQTERVNSIMEQYLRGYVNYEQDNWSELLPIAEFAYNNSWHSSVKAAPFYANYGYHPKATFNIVADETMTHVPSLEKLTEKIHKVQEELQAEMAFAQASHKEFSDKHRLPSPRYKVGEKVWLLRKNIKTKRPSDKLDYKRIGPYKVLRAIGNKAYELELEPHNRIHNVFHSSLLEPYTKSKFVGRKQQPRPQVVVENQEDWIIEKIIKAFYHKRRLAYLCHWQGFGNKDRTIEDAEGIQEDFPDLAKRFHEENPSQPTQLKL